MRGSDFALSRRSIPVYVCQVALLLCRAHRGVDFQRLTESIVKIAAHVVDKLRRPRTRITTVVLESRADCEVLGFDQWHKDPALFELFELFIVVNSREAGFV